MCFVKGLEITVLTPGPVLALLFSLLVLSPHLPAQRPSIILFVFVHVSPDF